jgi:hypothetical protein
MTHFHVAAMVVTNTAGGRVITSRQMLIDYPTAAAAAEVVVQLLEQHQGCFPIPSARPWWRSTPNGRAATRAVKATPPCP